MLDLGAIKEAGLSHVAARQELREMVSGLQLPEPADLFSRPALAATA